MSNLTYKEAFDDILSMVKASWDTTTWPMFYENVEITRPITDTPWARTVIRHVTGDKRTLGGSTSLYERTGNIFISVFTPTGEGLSTPYALCKVLSDAFEGQSSANGVWFRNTRIQEIGRDGELYQMNVIIDFTYTEAK